MPKKKVFTDDEIGFLLGNYKYCTNQQLADRLGGGVTRDQIRVKLQSLGLKRTEKQRKKLFRINRDRDINFWTKKEDRFLIKNYLRLSNIEISKHLNRSRSSIQTRLLRLGLRRPKPVAIKLRAKALTTWQPEWDAELRECYTLPMPELRKKFSRSESTIRKHMARLGLAIPVALREKRKKESQFKKGFKPWNRGLKGIHLSPGSEFKKGHQPYNTGYDGCERIRKDKCGKEYWYRRISKGRWVMLPRYDWEKEFGKIPKGKVLRAKDGDTLNRDFENWEIVSRLENLERNRNYEKAAKTMKRAHREGRLLTDKVVSYILHNPRRKDYDPELRSAIEKDKELIEAKRAQMMLKKELKDAANN